MKTLNILLTTLLTELTNMYKTINVLGYNVLKSPLTELDFSKKTVINTINQYSYCLAEYDSRFREALIKSDILLPDGIAIVIAGKLCRKGSIDKIAGADLHEFVLEELNKTSGSCFYLGSSNTTLTKIKDRIAVEYPNIKVTTYSPPYKLVFTDEDNKAMILEINQVNPDVVFIGMTAPKQEKWSLEFQDQLNTKLVCTIGAVFDFYAGTINRPSKVWINLGLEWFVRFIKEPRRLWERYFYYGPIFGWHLLKAIFKG